VTPTLSIAFQLSLLLFVAQAGYLLAAWLGQPAVVGAILAGVAIGPGVLGWVPYSDFIADLARMGAIVLVFVTGLEFGMEEIARPRHAAIALGGAVASWLGGYAVARGFGLGVQGAAVVGVTLIATSIAVGASTLREAGGLHTETARSVVGSALAGNVLALLALGAVAGDWSRGVPAAAIALTLVKGAGFLAVGAWVGRKGLPRLLTVADRAPITERQPHFVFVLALAAAFLYAMAAELAGLTAIVGAFLAGVCLEGVRVERGRPLPEGASYLRGLFAPLFFVALGVLADVRALTAGMAGFVAVLTVVAVAAKVGGSALGAVAGGGGLRHGAVVGLGMAPRGELATILALVALSRGWIAQPAYLAVVITSVLTSLLTPPLFRRLAPAPRTAGRPPGDPPPPG
jgi:Kef-type K+ transport system membrane component KefB